MGLRIITRHIFDIGSFPDGITLGAITAAVVDDGVFGLGTALISVGNAINITLHGTIILVLYNQAFSA